MADEKKQQKQSSSHERKETVYLDPSNKKFVEKYVEERGVTKSSLINEAVRSFKASLNKY